MSNEQSVGIAKCKHPRAPRPQRRIVLDLCASGAANDEEGSVINCVIVGNHQTTIRAVDVEAKLIRIAAAKEVAGDFRVVSLSAHGE